MWPRPLQIYTVLLGSASDLGGSGDDVTGDEPTLSELGRRIDDTRAEMRESFKDLRTVVNNLPTANDHAVVVRDLKRVEEAGKERMKAIEDDQETFASKLEANRKWLVSIALTGAGILIGLGGFIFSVVGK